MTSIDDTEPFTGFWVRKLPDDVVKDLGRICIWRTMREAIRVQSSSRKVHQPMSTRVYDLNKAFPVEGI